MPLFADLNKMLARARGVMVGTLFVVFLIIFSDIIYPFIPRLRFSSYYYISLWPVAAFPMFFGYVFGPITGFTVGFLGVIITRRGLPLGVGLSLGLEGLLMGLAARALPERKKRETAGLLLCALLAVLSSFITQIFAFLIDSITGDAFPPEIYMWLSMSDAINGAIFTPLITFGYYRIKHVMTMKESKDETASFPGFASPLEIKEYKNQTQMRQSFKMPTPLPPPPPVTVSANLNSELIQAVEKGDIVKVRYLLEKGANANARDSRGATALHKAASQGNVHIAQLLIEHGADVNSRNEYGATPLHYSKNGEVAELLIKHGADVDARDSDGWTPLHYVAEKGYLDVAKVLILHGASINAKTFLGLTPLHLAAEKGNIEVIKFLITHGADVNSRDAQGDTPLHLSVLSGLTDVVKLLLENGADPNIRGINNRTPLELAREMGYQDIVRVLEEYLSAMSLAIVGVEHGELFLDEWGKIILKVKGAGKASVKVEGDVLFQSPLSVDLSGETLIEVPIKPRATGEIPVTVTVESHGKKESKLVTLRVRTRVEFLLDWLLGRPVQLGLPSPGIKRLEKTIRLGDLECRGYLSTGGFATVLVCVDGLGISHAVKIPSQVFLELLASGTPTRIEIDLKPFLREVDVLRNASMHPCIVRFERFLDSQLALVFELCRCSLRDVLRQGGLGPVKAAEILVQIADALAFLHSKGYVHGDVKPENILFSFEGVPKLSDFNTAKALATVSKRTPGYTPGYAAPEQLKGEKQTEKADSWALGLVLYETITGKPLLPLDELEYKEAVAKLEKGMLTIGSTGVKEIDELVRLCLRINPAERPSALQIRDALAKYLLSQKISSVTKY
ncbi:MAG: ankyrin repeat domain-containing protein [Thermofilum sp.]|nr:ankyrin repeat domain-containing protein [Thermofilum sp.]